jgi:hypothetical protein
LKRVLNEVDSHWLPLRVQYDFIEEYNKTLTDDIRVYMEIVKSFLAANYLVKRTLSPMSFFDTDDYMCNG